MNVGKQPVTLERMCEGLLVGGLFSAFVHGMGAALKQDDHWLQTGASWGLVGGLLNLGVVFLSGAVDENVSKTCYGTRTGLAVTAACTGLVDYSTAALGCLEDWSIIKQDREGQKIAKHFRIVNLMLEGVGYSGPDMLEKLCVDASRAVFLLGFLQYTQRNDNRPIKMVIPLVCLKGAFDYLVGDSRV